METRLGTGPGAGRKAPFKLGVNAETGGWNGREVGAAGGAEIGGGAETGGW